MMTVVVTITQFVAAVPEADGIQARLVGQELMQRWSEPHRRYHTLAHLDFMLSVVDEFAGEADDADQVRLAAWFHDAIYDSGASDNERRSAWLAADRLGRLGVPAAEVVRLVELTATHQPAAGDRNGQLLCDADLAILGSSPADYARYAEAIRAEYSDVPPDAFRAGRAAILRRLSAVDHVYHRPPLRDRFEVAARANLASELALLG